MITLIAILLINIIIPVYLIIKFSAFRRANGFNRILKKAYQEKHGKL